MTTEACAKAGSFIQSRPDKDQGIDVKLGDLDCYISCPTSHQNAIGVVLAPDIFGWRSPLLRVNCDTLAAAGFVVAMPDFFRGAPLPQLPGGGMDPSKIGEFVAKSGSWNVTVRDDLVQLVIPHMKQKLNVSKICFIGFCWGGLMTLHCSSDSATNGLFACGVGIHASLKDPTWTHDAAIATKHPLLIIQGANDADIVPLQKSLSETPFPVTSYSYPSVLEKGKHYVAQFPDVNHGFCGTRGNRDDPVVLARVQEAISRTVEFFIINCS